MATVKIDLKNYRGLWKNLVNATMAPMTRDEYAQLPTKEQDVFCDELHKALERIFGFKILYHAGDGRPSRAFAQCLEFPDAQQAENFINFTIPKYIK